MLPWFESLLGPAIRRTEEVNPSNVCAGTQPGVFVGLEWPAVAVSFRDGGLHSYWIKGPALGEAGQPSIWGFSTGATIGRARSLRPDLAIARLGEPAGMHWHIGGDMSDSAIARVWGSAGAGTDDDVIDSVVGVAPGHRPLCND